MKVLPDGADLAAELKDYVAGKASYVGAATGSAHVQGKGWTKTASALSFGTTGKSKRVEAIKLSLPNQPLGGGITYEVHAQGRGWMPAASNGKAAGTTGKSKRLEAVRVSLTPGSELASKFSVWYRAHSQTYGWLGWAHDGEDAGTTGLSKRVEAIEVQVLPQGQFPAGYDAGKAACVSR